MSDSQGVDVQKWQDLGMECGSVREPWSQSFGLRSDVPGEVREREKGKEKKITAFQIFILGNPHGWEARVGQSREGYRGGRLSGTVWTRSAPLCGNQQRAARETLRQASAGALHSGIHPMQLDVISEALPSDLAPCPQPPGLSSNISNLGKDHLKVWHQLLVTQGLFSAGEKAHVSSSSRWNQGFSGWGERDFGTSVCSLGPLPFFPWLVLK